MPITLQIWFQALRPIRLRSAFLLLVAVLIREASIVSAAAQTAGVGGSRQTAQSRIETEGDPERGRQLAQANCAACHGQDGNSSDSQYPKLAGQSPDYLYWQLRAYKRGDRSSEIMASIASGLSDYEMADAAAYFSRQAIGADPVKDQRLAALGEHIFFSGAESGMAPACGMCHRLPERQGMQMMGMMAGAPRLEGQHAAYIFDQLDRFARGERKGAVMNRIAASLNNMEKVALAEYLSGLP